MSPARIADSLASDAQKRLAGALLALEGSRRQAPDAVLLQATSELTGEEFDGALLELYLGGLISYTTDASAIGRIAAALLGDESAYRLTPQGRAALAQEVNHHRQRKEQDVVSRQPKYEQSERHQL